MLIRFGMAAAIALATTSAAAAPLTYLNTITDANDLALGLDGARGITASSDGRFVFVCSATEDAVNVFARNPVSGALSFVEAQRDGLAGVDGLEGAFEATLSPDDRFLYVASTIENAVAVFSVAPGTGSLSFVEQQKNGVAGVTGLSSPGSPIVSPDGRHLYVGGFGEIVLFAREAGGGLDYVETVDAGGIDFDSVGTVVISPDGRHVYASSFNPNGRLLAYERDAVTGHLDFLEAYEGGSVDGINGIQRMLLSRDGRDLYATAVNGNSVAHFERDSATGALDFVSVFEDGVGGVDGLFDAFGIALSTDQTRLFAAGTESKAAVFARDETTGALDFTITQTFLANPTGLDLAVVGHHLYTTDNNDDAVVTLSIAELSFVEFQQDGVAGANGIANPEAIAATADGRHLLVGSFSDDTLTSFAVDPATGGLDFADAETDDVAGVTGLNGVYGVAVSPDGAHVYVTSTNPGGGLVAFTRNAATGALGFVGAQPGAALGLRSLAVSRDGRNVYVPDFVDHSVETYTRNASTGALTLLDSDVDGVGGVDGLEGANGVAVARDGSSVYVASTLEDAVAAFSRNPTTGALTFAGAWFDGQGGVDGLDGARAVAISPDARFVYVVGRLDNAVAIFARNATTHALTYVERIADGIGGVELLGGAYALAFGPGGDTLIVSAEVDDAITVFRRDRETGRLFLAQTEVNGESGITSLGGTRPIAVIDGLATYVGSNDLDTVTVFAPEPGGTLLAFTAACALASVARRRVA